MPNNTPRNDSTQKLPVARGTFTRTGAKSLREAAASAVEALEARQMLSGSAFMEGYGNMLVRGTTGNDSIKISKDPTNSGEIRVEVNGQRWDFKTSWVKLIRVEADKGNDRVETDTAYGNVDAGVFVLGGPGYDTLISETGGDALFGGGEADVLIATSGNNVINGGDGNDRLFAGPGNDTIVGEGGNDYIQNAGGVDSINGGSGSNMIVKAALPSTIPTYNGPLPGSTSQTPPAPVPVTAPSSSGPQPVPTTSSGQPFVIGVWSQPTWSFDKWKGRGINTVVGYESMSGTVSIDKFSQEAQNKGLYMIRHPNWQDPSKDRAYKNLLAWMHNDEPDYKGVPADKLVADYRKLKAVDPNKPVFVNFAGSMALWGYGGYKQADYQKWMAGADWISNDLYPITAHNRAWELDAPGEAVEKLSRWSGGKRQFAVIEASDQELPDHLNYPGVTADQFRAEVFNAVISGATGIIYFPQRIGKGFLFDSMNSSVEVELKKVNSRLAAIGPALMTAENPSGVSMDVDGALRVTWRKYGGKTYFIVLNNSTQYVSARMDVHGVNANTTAKVDGENRSVSVKNGQISDGFKPLEAHVYVV
jgi:Ca2+-binding RTX toxin-like protein